MISNHFKIFLVLYICFYGFLVIKGFSMYHFVITLHNSGIKLLLLYEQSKEHLSVLSDNSQVNSSFLFFSQEDVLSLAEYLNRSLTVGQEVYICCSVFGGLLLLIFLKFKTAIDFYLCGKPWLYLLLVTGTVIITILPLMALSLDIQTMGTVVNVLKSAIRHIADRAYELKPHVLLHQHTVNFLNIISTIAPSLFTKFTVTGLVCFSISILSCFF